MNEIKRGLLPYLIAEQSFEDFQEWLADLAWAPVGRFQPADVELVREIELRVAEYTGGFLTEGELRSVLREVLGVTPRVVHFLWEMESAPVRQPAPVAKMSASAPVRRSMAF